MILIYKSIGGEVNDFKWVFIFVILISLNTAYAGQDKFIMRYETPLIAPVVDNGVSWDGGDIEIAFWNIEYWPGGMFERSLEPPSVTSVANQMVAVKSILDRDNPSIIITSEMHSLNSALFLNGNLAKPYPHIAATAYMLDNNSDEILFFENIEERHKPPRADAGRRHEHAVFSRLVWSEIHEIEIDTYKEIQPRGFVLVCFEIGNRKLWIYGVHSSALASWQEYRLMKPGFLLNDMQKRGLDPRNDWIIVTGDFNLNLYTSHQVRENFVPFFKAGFVNTFDLLDHIPVTKPDSGGGTTIDYIFVSEGLGARSSKVIDDSAGYRPAERAGRDYGIASDHRMVVVKISKEELK